MGCFCTCFALWEINREVLSKYRMLFGAHFTLRGTCTVQYLGGGPGGGSDGNWWSMCPCPWFWNTMLPIPLSSPHPTPTPRKLPLSLGHGWLLPSSLWVPSAHSLYYSIFISTLIILNLQKIQMDLQFEFLHFIADFMFHLQFCHSSKKWRDKLRCWVCAWPPKPSWSIYLDFVGLKMIRGTSLVT